MSMMLSLRNVPRLTSRISVRALSTPTISGGSMGKAWADKEHAAENQYFNRKDAEVLAALAKKLEAHAAPSQEEISAHRDSLKSLFDKHSAPAPSDALLDDLLKFKFSHE